MERRFRVVMVVMVVVLWAFAAGLVANVVSSATMSTTMALAAIDSADMGDCQDCLEGNGDMPSCYNACVSPILAVVPSAQPSLPEAETTTESPVLQSVTERTGPPDPYPPKSIILS